MKGHIEPDISRLTIFVSSQVSADKLDSITAFAKFFNQASYTKLVSYRRAIFQALEVNFGLVPLYRNLFLLVQCQRLCL